MGRILIFILGFVLFAGFVSAECTEPADGMIITQDTVLCQGNYRLNNGIIVKGTEITLDCDGATLEGNFKFAGITANGYDIEIKNCNIFYFEKGLELRNSKVLLTNSVLAKNSVGVYNIDSLIDYFDSNVSDNLDPAINISMPEGQFLMFEDVLDEEEAEYSRQIQVPNIFKEEALALLDLSGEKIAAKEEVIIEIFRQYVDGYTQYNIAVTPQKDIVDLKLFVDIPKIVASDSEFIELNEASYDIVNLDPIQYVFYLTDMVAGEQREVQVLIKKRVIQNEDIAAIATYTKTLRPWENFLVITLFCSSAVLYFTNKHFRKRVKEKEKYI